jgi:cytochrome c biogenesis protein CcmG/thiol:disulfide interchange protein DsbE
MSKTLLIAFLVLGSIVYIWKSKVDLNQISTNSQSIEVVLNKELIFKSLQDKDKKISEVSSKKYILVHFWATWCGPCEAEFPELIKFGKRISNNVDIFFIAVNDETNAVKKFVNRFKEIDQNFIFLDNLSIHQNNFGVYKLPETFLFDQFSGKMVKRFVGPQDWNSEYFYQVMTSLQ